jgi:hypothetical protein
MTQPDGVERPRPVRTLLTIVAILLALVTAGCAEGSRGGSDQPGVPGPPPGTQISVNESSEDDVAAALRSRDVDDPGRWARIVMENRPYPAGAPGTERLRQVLAQHGAAQDEIAKMTDVLKA